jgi:hypothetical protein
LAFDVALFRVPFFRFDLPRLFDFDMCKGPGLADKKQRTVVDVHLPRPG